LRTFLTHLTKATQEKYATDAQRTRLTQATQRVCCVVALLALRWMETELKSCKHCHSQRHGRQPGTPWPTTIQ